MPCIQIPCPCRSAEELASIGEDGFAMCTAGSNKLQILNTTVGHARNQAEADTSVDRERCRFLDFTAPRTIRSFSITPEEAQSCFSQVEQACAGL